MQTILILDDEPAIRLSLSSYFEDHLWEVITAESSEEALEYLEKTIPEAAIVDIRLPGMDGNGFAKEVCRRKLPMGIIFCTGSPEYSISPDLAKEKNVLQKLFSKPIANLSELETSVKKLIKAKKEQQE